MEYLPSGLRSYRSLNSSYTTQTSIAYLGFSTRLIRIHENVQIRVYRLCVTASKISLVFWKQMQNLRFPFAIVIPTQTETFVPSFMLSSLEHCVVVVVVVVILFSINLYK